MTGPVVTEEERGRRTNWRISLLTVSVGILGVVVGGVIAGASAYYTAQDQSKSQASESRVEFQRTQRQETYSKFLTDYRGFFDMNSALYSAADDLNRTPGSSVVVASKRKAVVAKYEALFNQKLDSIYHDLETISLVQGSEDVETKASTVRTDLARDYFDLNARAMDFPPESDYGKDLDKTLADLAAFIKVAKLDITSN